MKKFLAFLLLVPSLAFAQRVTDYVDPRIGTIGPGHTTIGPSMPFGMVKPGPDCGLKSCSGYKEMPAEVDGFSQIHVSGTGGNPKYGNILIMPFTEGVSEFRHPGIRTGEEASLGYYKADFENGISVEVTAAQKASAYRIHFPSEGDKGLLVDAKWCLGVSDTDETQKFEGGKLEVVSENTVEGWSTISGGWNQGGPYTVYFHLETDRPAAECIKGQYACNLLFDKGTDVLNVRVGLSFLNLEKARQNFSEYIDGKSFDEVHDNLLDRWEEILGKIEIDRKTPFKYKRMFYTGLYRTCLMPVDRTREWDGCGPEETYYDDFYTIWDIYRSSLPLLTILDPQREVEIVNSLLTIYKHDGYMPDGRSGNCNGRTQSASNAEIVIADAFVKGLKGIDYELALEAMLKDAEVEPEDFIMEGRGNVEEYGRLGYVSGGIRRAGSRTVDYSLCDYAIAVVADGLGHEDIAEKYYRRASNWKNLWRADYEMDGIKGFIMPRAADGSWIKAIPFGHSELRKATYDFWPDMVEAVWYVHHWDRFFYEASSSETSLSVPHDIPGLIDLCGGKESFQNRLDKFFCSGGYNVNNEPSFLTPCLYHWVGRPDITAARTAEIIGNNYSDTPDGLPGNDDSGAMSSWLAFHMTGLYPNAGQPYYVLHSPLVRKAVFHVAEGRTFTILARGLSRNRCFIQSARLNGKRIDPTFLTHEQLVAGGRLVLRMGRKALGPMNLETQSDPDPVIRDGKPLTDTLMLASRLHYQNWNYLIRPHRTDEGIRMDWCLTRKGHLWQGSYLMKDEDLQDAGQISFVLPEKGNEVVLKGETFAMVPVRVLTELKSAGRTDFNSTTYKVIDTEASAMGRPLIHVLDINEGTEMWILDNPELPLIWRMKNNPLEIDWTIVNR